MEDVFKFQVNQLAEKHGHSKRSFLKKIAILFDPLGLLSPYTVRAKVLLQEMWASGVDWDEPVNENLSMKASRWFKELSALVNIQIPRCLRTTKAVKEVALHTFVDASQEAYGAVAYTRYSCFGLQFNKSFLPHVEFSFNIIIIYVLTPIQPP